MFIMCLQALNIDPEQETVFRPFNTSYFNAFYDAFWLTLWKDLLDLNLASYDLTFASAEHHGTPPQLHKTSLIIPDGIFFVSAIIIFTTMNGSVLA